MVDSCRWIRSLRRLMILLTTSRMADSTGMGMRAYSASVGFTLIMAAMTITDNTTVLIEYITAGRSEEHTSELQSLMRISYAVFCLKKKTITTNPNIDNEVL